LKIGGKRPMAKNSSVDSAMAEDEAERGVNY
jgi:hypothetical protein